MVPPLACRAYTRKRRPRPRLSSGNFSSYLCAGWGGCNKTEGVVRTLKRGEAGKERIFPPAEDTEKA